MSQPVEILLVEDNPGDVELTREGMKDARVANRLHVVEDGEQAMDFLYQRGDYATAPRPDLILLDLNLPGISGREVLTQIKQDEKLCAIPVVVLTSSEAEADIMRSYQNYANCYVQKPVDLDKFLHLVRQIEEYWFMLVKLPSATAS